VSLLVFWFLSKAFLDGGSPRKAPCAVYPQSRQRSFSTFRHAHDQFRVSSPAADLHDPSSLACIPRNIRPIQLCVSYYRPFSPPTPQPRYNRRAATLRNALQQFRRKLEKRTGLDGQIPCRWDGMLGRLARVKEKTYLGFIS